MNFDRLAAIYQAMEWISAGNKLQRCRVAFLDQIQPPRRILLAGEGHGRFLPTCARAFPEAHITVVDCSERMLAIARKRFTDQNIEFVHADLLSWSQPPDGFDLIVTHFLLDCFAAHELEVLVARLGRLATPDACWLVADFRIPDSGLAAWRSRMILAILYRFFRTTCGISAKSLASSDSALAKAGFSLHRQETSDWGLLKCEWWNRKSTAKCREETPSSSDRFAAG